MSTKPVHVLACEDALKAERAYNIDHDILPSEVKIVDRLLARSDQLIDAYEDIYIKLHRHPQALQVFLGVVVNAAAFWNPEKMAKARESRREQEQLQDAIARQARLLAQLLERQSTLNDTSHFISDSHYHIVDVIVEAAHSNGHFRGYVKQPLELLAERFDPKYWPSLAEILNALAANADQSGVQPSNSTTAAGTAGSRPSKADYFNSLFDQLSHCTTNLGGFLPSDTKITDEALADLANCALDLPESQWVDGPYVKRRRQQLRQQSAGGGD